MTINSISSVGAAHAVSGNRPPPPPDSKGPYETVSSLLDMSADDIASAVRSGTSLTDLAASKGVSQEDLIAALKAGAPEELQGTAELDSIVTDIATRTGSSVGPGGPGVPPPGPPPSGLLSGNLTSSQSEMLESLGELLDMSSDELAHSLASGTNLSSLLQEKGVTLSWSRNPPGGLPGRRESLTGGRRARVGARRPAAKPRARRTASPVALWGQHTPTEGPPHARGIHD
jgi:hypothetical protein